MAAKIEALIQDLAKVRGEIAFTKMRLAQAEETERELLRQILGLVTEENEDGESLWSQQMPSSGDFEMAHVIGQDVAVLKIQEEYHDRSAARLHEAVNVEFIPLAQQAL